MPRTAPYLLVFALLFSALSTALPALEKPPLLTAVRNGELDTVRELLAAGADPESANRYGATTVTFAASRGHVEILRLLLEAGANPDPQDTFYGMRASQWAASEGHWEAVLLLIEKGAAPGQSLSAAILQGSVDTVAGILERAELTPEQLAQALSQAEGTEGEEQAKIAELLKARGAHPTVLIELEDGQLARLLGGYGRTDSEHVEAWVRTEESAVIVEFVGSPARRFEALEPTVLRPEGGNPPYTVHFLGDGEKAESLEVRFEGRDPVVMVRRSDATGLEAEIGDTSESETPVAVAELTEPIAVPEGVADGNWPAFRGPNAAGSARGPAPTTWDVPEGKNVLWNAKVPGIAHASPILWGDRLFLATAISEEDPVFRHGLFGDVEPAGNEAVHRWQVMALDKHSGELLWLRTAYEGKPRVDNHTKATQVNSTPVTNGERVVALLGSEGLFCYSMDGDLLWQRDLGMLDAGWFYDPDFPWGHASSPIIAGDAVILQVDRAADSFLVAFALEDGRELWRVERDNLPSWGTPTLLPTADGGELITNGTPVIRAYDPKTGAELWQLGPNSEITVGTPVVGHGMVYVVGGYPPVRPIYAVRPGGRGDLSLTEGDDPSPQMAWSKERGGTYMPTPIVYGDLLYTLRNNGVLTAYDALSGEQIYRERAAARGGTAFTASPVAADGKLFLASEDGEVYVIRAGRRFERLAVNPVGEIMMATPAISDGVLYLRTTESLLAIAETEDANTAAEDATAEAEETAASKR